MTEPLKFSIAAQLKTLRESITSNLSWPSPETEFARTVLSNFGVASHYEFFASQRDLGTIASRMQEAPILAAVGFGVSNADTKSQELWAKSVERLTTRETFPNDRVSFFYRPIELLGIAYGVSGCPHLSPAVKKWFKTTLQIGEQKMGDTDYWSFEISRYSAFLHNIPWRPGHFHDLSIEDVALSLWLEKRAPGFAKPGRPNGGEDLSAMFLQRCLLEGVPSRDVAREAIVYGAMHSVAEKA